MYDIGNVLLNLSKVIEGDKDAELEDRDIDFASPIFLFTLHAIWFFLNNPNIPTSLKEDVKIGLMDSWTKEFLTFLIRRFDSPVNIRPLLLKLYLSLHPFEDFHLINRCILKPQTADGNVTKFNQIPSIPILMTYAEDALFVVGKVVLFYFLLSYRPSERATALEGRVGEILGF